MMIKVQKKDGRLEDFDRNKVSQGIIKSGGMPDQAENIAAQVETWAQTTAVNGVIGTGEIRNKVLELLRAVNPEVAAGFEAYRKAI